MGSRCLQAVADTFDTRGKMFFEMREHCFHFLTNRAIVDHFIREGSYLMTPGWLSRWEDHIRAWGFDKATAQQFFHEFAKQILLLDTGVDPKAIEHLRDLAHFLELPYNILPVGLDVFHLVVGEITKTGQYRHEIRLLKSFKAWDIVCLLGVNRAVFLVDCEENGTSEAMVRGQDLRQLRHRFLGAVFLITGDKNDILGLGLPPGAFEHDPLLACLSGTE